MSLKTILVSFIFCLLSFVIVRVTDNFLLSEFLRFNEINHDYYLFFIEYKNGRLENWTEGKLIFINTVPYFLAILTGIYLPHISRNIGNKTIQLFLTWFSFHLVLLFTGGLISGLFEYKGLGVALVWFLNYKSLQVIAVIITVLVISWSLRRFAWYFVRCMLDCEELFDVEIKYRQFRKLALYPYLLTLIPVFSLISIETVLNHSISCLTGLLFILLLFQTLPDVIIPGNTAIINPSN